MLPVFILNGILSKRFYEHIVQQSVDILIVIIKSIPPYVAFFDQRGYRDPFKRQPFQHVFKGFQYDILRGIRHNRCLPVSL
jgi:hypothetical protein